MKTVHTKMTRRLGTNVPIAILMLGIILVGIGIRAGSAPAGTLVASTGSTAIPASTDPGSSSAPTAEDASRAAAQQLAALPHGVYQVPCSASLETFPPYTVLTGGIGVRSESFHVLADGRCFFDPNAQETPAPTFDELPGAPGPSQ